MTVPLEMVALTTSRIYLMMYLILQILTKCVIKLVKKIKFLCNLIESEAKEGAE